MSDCFRALILLGFFGEFYEDLCRKSLLVFFHKKCLFLRNVSVVFEIGHFVNKDTAFKQHLRCVFRDFRDSNFYKNGQQTVIETVIEWYLSFTIYILNVFQFRNQYIFRCTVNVSIHIHSVPISQTQHKGKHIDTIAQFETLYFQNN